LRLRGFRLRARFRLLLRNSAPDHDAAGRASAPKSDFYFLGLSHVGRGRRKVARPGSVYPLVETPLRNLVVGFAVHSVKDDAGEPAERGLNFLGPGPVLGGPPDLSEEPPRISPAPALVVREKEESRPEAKLPVL